MDTEENNKREISKIIYKVEIEGTFRRGKPRRLREWIRDLVEGGTLSSMKCEGRTEIKYTGD